MSPQLQQMADLLGQLQQQQAQAGRSDAMESFGGVFAEISTALGDIVDLLEKGQRNSAAHQKAEDARQASAHQVLAKALQTALRDAVAGLKVESKPEVKVNVGTVQAPAITVPAIKAPAVEVQSMTVHVAADLSSMPPPQVTLLPAPPAPPPPPMTWRIEIERDANGFAKEFQITRSAAR